MKLIRLVLLVAFSAFATSAFAQTVPMPDYSKWEKTADHSNSYLLEGKLVEMRDAHYEFVNKETTEESAVLVFYHPNSEKTWFAIYIRYDKWQLPLAYLYESDHKDGAWIFVADVTSDGSVDSTLKRYGLVEVLK